MIAFREQYTPHSDQVEPWVNLAIAILETTIQDIHILRRAGLLVNGETKRPWPIARGWKRGDTNKHMRASNHYNHPRTVDELIAFVRGPYLAELIEWSGISMVTQDDFIKHLEGKTPLIPEKGYTKRHR
jgi:hypothetical protein